jgi:hypothetical protein
MSSKKVTGLSVGFGIEGASYHVFGQQVEVIGLARGWATVKILAGRRLGVISKVRTTEVVLVLDETPSPAPSVAAKAAVATNVAASSSKAKKTAKKTAKKVDEDGEYDDDDEFNVDMIDIDDCGPSRRIAGAPVNRFATYTRSTTTNGNVTYDNGDSIASHLRDMSLDEVYAYAADVLEVSIPELRAKYHRLNTGMQRMNLGNRVRAKMKALGISTHL